MDLRELWLLTFYGANTANIVIIVIIVKKKNIDTCIYNLKRSNITQ